MMQTYEEDDMIDESEFDSTEVGHLTSFVDDHDDDDNSDDDGGVELVALSGSGSAILVKSLPYTKAEGCRKRCVMSVLFLSIALFGAYAVLNYPLFGDGYNMDGNGNGKDAAAAALVNEDGMPPAQPSPPVTMDPEMMNEEEMNEETIIINEAEQIMEEEEAMEEEMNEIQEEYVDIDMDDVAALEDDLIFEEMETFVGAAVKPIPFATLQDGVRFEVLETFPHDPTSFTQGLSYNNGILYESTGLNGKSKVRRLDATTLDVIQSIDIPRQYFGEGIAYHNGNLVQITWKKRRGFVYDANDLSLLLDFPFETEKMEGWGITHDAFNNRFVVSDGSQYLHFWDDQTLEEVGERVKVWRLDGSPAKDMNELEFWRGKVLANVWYEDTILVINAVTGFVESEYDFSSLWPKHERKKEGADVLNGISISQDEDVLFVTGKFWKYMFKVRLI